MDRSSEKRSSLTVVFRLFTKWISDWWGREETYWWETAAKILIGVILAPIVIPVFILLFVPLFVGWILRTLSVVLLYPYLYETERPSKTELIQSTLLWVLVFLYVDWSWIAKIFMGAWIYGISQLF
jgi:low temperature requirement protein LtrA